MTAAISTFAPRVRVLAEQAVAALVTEARLTPKPGLVDARGGGSHTDMDLPLLVRSAAVLGPWFAIMARTAQQHCAPTRALRAELAAIGRAAEYDMLAATGGVNTHRGAIWALGLLVAAAAIDAEAAEAGVPTRITALAGRIARHPDIGDHPQAVRSHGALASARFGVGGARGQARAGFPHLIGVALPTLWAARSRGATETAARLDALLALMAELDDTCVLYRGGTAGQAIVRQGARAVLAAGGTATLAGRHLLDRLDGRLAAARLSPGGCGDLLAATLFLDALCPMPVDLRS